MSDSPAKPRRFLRFSLRAMLLLMVVFALALAAVHKVRQQRIAVGALQEFGCQVLYFSKPELTPLEKLRQFAGDEQPRNVCLVNAAGSQLTDERLVHLGGLSQLSYLILDQTQLSDAGMAYLASLSQLRHLRLHQTQITDSGLAQLCSLTQLESLGVKGTNITDAGLAQFPRLSGLRTLCLDHTQVSDAGLAHLRSMTNLVYLSLEGTRVTDAGICELENTLPNLVILR